MSSLHRLCGSTVSLSFHQLFTSFSPRIETTVPHLLCGFYNVHVLFTSLFSHTDATLKSAAARERELFMAFNLDSHPAACLR